MGRRGKTISASFSTKHSASGDVLSADIVSNSASAAFEGSALATVKLWRFEPATIGECLFNRRLRCLFDLNLSRDPASD